MEIKQFLEAIQYKITEGSDFCWTCYGSNARYLDSTDDKYSASIVFDGTTQTVYEATVCDYVNNRAYRWYNPLFKENYEQEARERKINVNQAWDDVNYGDTDSEEDLLDKIKAIVEGVEYDTRVTLTVDLSDAELLQIMKLAHDRDITFNQMVEEILQDAIDRAKDLVGDTL